MVGFPTQMFVTQPVDENLVCAICLSVLDDPTTACSNGHTFCASCIEQHEKRGNDKCPSCRETLAKSRNLPLRNMISAMRVRCPQKQTPKAAETSSSSSTNDDDGDDDDAGRSSKRPRLEEGNASDACASCHWEGTLSDYLAKHKKSDCQYAMALCPLGCRKVMCVTELKAHKDNECPHRIVQCEPCGKEMMQYELKPHQNTQCPEANTKCRYCGQQMLRKLLGTMPDLHDRIDDTSRIPDPDNLQVFGRQEKNKFTGHYKACSKMKVHCEFHNMGCWKSIKREDLDGHHARYARAHAKMVADQIKSIRDGKYWTSSIISWQIPTRLLRRPSSSRGTFTTKSQSVKVGDYDAYLKLIATNGGSVEVKVCVDNPTAVPISIDRLEIECYYAGGSFDIGEKREMESSADASGTIIHSLGSKLTCFNVDMDERRDSTLQDLVRNVPDGHYFLLTARFRLRGPDRVFVGCDEE